MRPNTNEYNNYYHNYIISVPDGSIQDNLEETFKKTEKLLSTVSEEKGNYRYAEDKWTVKELIIHMIEVERVMSYRAFRISRNDKTAILGFNHNEYVKVSNANARPGRGASRDRNCLKYAGRLSSDTASISLSARFSKARILGRLSPGSLIISP